MMIDNLFRHQNIWKDHCLRFVTLYFYQQYIVLYSNYYVLQAFLLWICHYSLHYVFTLGNKKKITSF